MFFVAHPVAVGDSGTARDGDNIGAARGRGLLPAGDLIDAVVHDDDGQIARLDHPDGSEAAERHQNRAVAFERDDTALGLGERNAEGDRTSESHAAEHVEILRSVPGGIEVEIGIADAGDHGFVAGELRDQPLRQIGAVEHLDSRSVDRRRGHVPHLNLAAAAGFPPVSSGEKMNTTGLCVVNACLMDLSTMKGMVASSLSV